MSIEEVIRIMGLPPDSISRSKVIHSVPIKILGYPSNNTDGLEVEVRFDSIYRLSKVIIPYNWGSNVSYEQ